MVWAETLSPLVTPTLAMDTPPVTLGPAEQRQLYVLTELLAGRLTAIEAALSLDISIRHLKRQKARVAAAKRGSSVSRLLAEQIDVLSRQDDDLTGPCMTRWRSSNAAATWVAARTLLATRCTTGEDVRRYGHRPLCV